MSFHAGLPAHPDLESRAAAVSACSGGPIAASALWWPPPGDDRPPRITGLALGLGALYNHAAKVEDHNIRWTLHPGMGVVVMQARRAIRRGSELFLDYGADYWAGRHCEPSGPR